MSTPTASFQVRNPYTQETLAELPFDSRSSLEEKVAGADTKFKTFRRTPTWRKSEILRQLAEGLAREKENFANLISKESGKPISLARAEVDRAIQVASWAAGETQRYAGEMLQLDAFAGGKSGFGIHQRFPYGVVLGIAPFNFPLNLVMHKVAPAIAVGCPILIKPSLFTPLTSLKLAELLSGLEQNLVQVVLPKDEDVPLLTQHPKIPKVSFTGSAKIGHLIRQQALDKYLTLELGGNAWVVVTKDTDSAQYPAIAKRMVQAGFGYAGQTCISIQNVAVASEIWDDFIPELEREVCEVPFGDPLEPSTVCGPLIHSGAKARVEALLSALPHGTKTLTSSKLIQPGSSESKCLQTPTAIFLTPKQAFEEPLALVQEEVFGPLLSVAPFSDLDPVIRRINSSSYGLQAGIYTQHWPTIQRLYQELEVGGVVINDAPTTRYDHQPYGGIKDSGMGREGVRYAMDAMTYSKFLALS